MKGWNILKLDDLCEFKNGLWTGKKPPYQNVGVIRNTNFTKDGYLDDSDIAYLDVEIKQYTTRKLEFGDIILEKSGGGPKQPVGRVIPFTKDSGDFSFSNFTSVVRIRDKEKIDYRYLHKILYFFYVSGVTEPMQTHSTGIRNLQLKEYKNLSIPVPPLSEQKRIVSIVDEAFEAIDIAIDNTKQNLTNARELFDSYLNAIFTQKGDGWVNKRLGDISEVQSGGTPLRSKNEYWGGSLAWYSSGELNDLYTSVPERNVTELGLKNSNAKSFPKGSLLIGMYDTAALKMSILDREAAFNQAIAGVKPNSEIDLTFILHAINSVKPELLNLRRGVRQKNLSLQKIKDIVLAVPKLQEQQLVVRRLACMSKETQRLEAIYRKKLTALNELKQSILHKAFTGELTADRADLKTNIDREAIAV
jgi:type I restriction enzyme, S subunit